MRHADKHGWFWIVVNIFQRHTNPEKNQKTYSFKIAEQAEAGEVCGKHYRVFIIYFPQLDFVFH